MPQHADGDKLSWEGVEEAIDDLWEGCGERWAEEELDRWKKEKGKRKEVDLKLFKKIVSSQAIWPCLWCIEVFSRAFCWENLSRAVLKMRDRIVFF